MESLAEEAELALSLWTCYIMEHGGPYGVEINVLMKRKKKRYTILYYSGKPAETVFHLAFARVICPQMTSGTIKFQPLFRTTTARHKILESILHA